jgi:hypothetical protein
VYPERVNPYPADWQAIRARVLERAAGHCEFCGVRAGTMQLGKLLEVPGDGQQIPLLGSPRAAVLIQRLWPVVLTCAHLRHDRADRDLAYIRALCQRCHLSYDRNDRWHLRRVKARLAGQLEMEPVFDLIDHAVSPRSARAR